MTQVTATSPPKPRSGSALRRWVVRLLVVVLVGVPAVAAVNILSSARAYDTSATDAIAVLGASQYWGTPSPVFSNRLDHAYDLWAQGVAPLIVTVGGKVEGDITTEAEAGRDYLVRKGVPSSAVVALPGGSDTIESIEMIDAELAARDLDSVTLVSDRLHLARSKAIAKAVGLDVHVSGRAFADGSSFIPERFVREMGGLVKFHFWDRWFLGDLPAGE